MEHRDEAAPPSAQDRLPISVVVPVRNGAGMIDRCLRSIAANLPAEVIVVDGNSVDATRTLARPYADAVLSDGGRGVAYARVLGARHARSVYVAFIDVDVELPAGALALLLDELISRRLQALQAGLQSCGDEGYWSYALATHHNCGRSRRWFGLCATLFERDTFLRYPTDESFVTGEDIELRHRLDRAGVATAVSSSVHVRHYFPGGFRFALRQWTSDGAGIGRLVRRHRWRAMALLLTPAGGFALGLVRVVWRRPLLAPYYVCYLVFNYASMVKGLLDRSVTNRQEKGEGRTWTS